MGSIWHHAICRLSFSVVHCQCFLSKSLQLIKGGSSKWVHDSIPEQRHFSWQEGYGAFSIGITQVDDTVSYIERPAEHHRRRSFQEEFLAFLEKHHIEYDPRYLWD